MIRTMLGARMQGDATSRLLWRRCAACGQPVVRGCAAVAPAGPADGSVVAVDVPAPAAPVPDDTVVVAGVAVVLGVVAAVVDGGGYVPAVPSSPADSTGTPTARMMSGTATAAIVSHDEPRNFWNQPRRASASFPMGRAPPFPKR